MDKKFQPSKRRSTRSKTVTLLNKEDLLKDEHEEPELKASERIKLFENFIKENNKENIKSKIISKSDNQAYDITNSNISSEMKKRVYFNLCMNGNAGDGIISSFSGIENNPGINKQLKEINEVSGENVEKKDVKLSICEKDNTLIEIKDHKATEIEGHNPSEIRDHNATEIIPNSNSKNWQDLFYEVQSPGYLKDCKEPTDLEKEQNKEPIIIGNTKILIDFYSKVIISQETKLQENITEARNKVNLIDPTPDNLNQCISKCNTKVMGAAKIDSELKDSTGNVSTGFNSKESRNLDKFLDFYADGSEGNIFNAHSDVNTIKERPFAVNAYNSITKPLESRTAEISKDVTIEDEIITSITEENPAIQEITSSGTNSTESTFNKEIKFDSQKESKILDKKRTDERMYKQLKRGIVSLCVKEENIKKEGDVDKLKDSASICSPDENNILRRSKGHYPNKSNKYSASDNTIPNSENTTAKAVNDLTSERTYNFKELLLAFQKIEEELPGSLMINNYLKKFRSNEDQNFLLNSDQKKNAIKNDVFIRSKFDDEL